jgi:hypothetical protein
MKIVLVGVLIVATTGLSAQQDQAQAPCRDFGDLVATSAQVAGQMSPERPVTESTAQATARVGRNALIEQLRKTTGIGVTADCIEPRPPSLRRAEGFRAQGNVTLSYGDIVITADDAVVKDGEIQLGANARVRVPQPTR